MSDHPEIKKFLGLYRQPNSFNLPDGAMERALNVYISDDDRITKARGFYQYYDPGSLAPNALVYYQGKLLCVFSDRLSYFGDAGAAPNLTGTRTDNGGAAIAVTGTRRSRAMEAGGNLLLTTDNGVMKLDGYNQSAYAAGAPPGRDIRAIFDLSNGVMPADTQVAYRILFGRRDNNDNVILGAPSDILVVTNTTRDFQAYTSTGAGPWTVTVTTSAHEITTGMSITVFDGSDTDVNGIYTVTVPVFYGLSKAYTSSGAGPYTVTVTNTAHGLVAGMSITVTNATDSDANGTVTITATTANTFSYSVAANPTSGTLDYTAPQNQFSFTVSAADPSASGHLSWKTTRTVVLEASIPPDITSGSDGWFYQLYRTSFSGDDAVSPQSNFRLVEEAYLATADIAAKVIFVTDDIDDVLVTYAAELYTNPNSQEGELQANDRPPLCKDLVLYNDRALFANCTTRQRLEWDVVDTDASTIADNDYVEFKVDGVARRYVAKSGVGNTMVRAEFVTSSGTTVTVYYTGHNFSTDDVIRVSNVKGGGAGAPTGTYPVTRLDANRFTFTTGVAPVSLTGLDFQGVTNGAYPIFSLLQSGTIATRLRTTAKGLVKAVNRDAASVIYGIYASGITDVPGKMRFLGTGFTGVIYARAVTAAATTPGEAFDPPAPSSFAAGTQVYSRGSSLPHVIIWSKAGEHEAAPFTNQTPVGSRNAGILRIKALRDAIIVVKADGVFKVVGTGSANAVVTPLDLTVICIAEDSVERLADQVYLLSNQGICIVTTTAVQVVGRKISNLIEPVVGKATIAAVSGAVSYESHNTYRLATAGPNDTTRTVGYAHNTRNDTWTEFDVLFTTGIIGPSDTLYLISPTGKILKERKNSTKVDFCGQHYVCSVVSVAADKLSAVISVPAGCTPEVGDVIIEADTITRFDTVSQQTGSNWAITMSRVTNLTAPAGSVTLYKGYESIIEMAPITGGAVGIMKHFAEFQMHTRSFDIYRCYITFGGYETSASTETVWASANLYSVAGWGDGDWGFFFWGLGDGVNNAYLTQPAPPIRTYVPEYAARSTYIKPRIRHREAADALNIQAMSFAARSYSARVSK